jgi:predicted ABC-class ATPase
VAQRSTESQPSPAARSAEELRQHLYRLDRRPYPAYRDLIGLYRLPGFVLSIDHVQPDPFAAPSRMRAFVPREVAALPPDTYATRVRRIALEDFLAREFSHQATLRRPGRGDRGGSIEMDAPGQEVLERTAVTVTDGAIEARFTANLPASGRVILGRDATMLFLDDLPRIIERALSYPRLERATLARHQRTVEAAEFIRERLTERGLVALIAAGAVLPRRSGVDPRPLRGANVVPFRPPSSLRVTFQLPDGIEVAGLGIPRGVTVIVGGGFHGKSTLLSAIELGVYNHIATDGRELVITEPGAVKVRAEDGRSVAGVDISAFITGLPGGIDTTAFSTADASGSTSQAASIAEAIEIGATTLLLDEDTCAANFMLRDRRMQELVAKEYEPITPFLDRVRQLYDERGVSTILVMGGSGEYLDVADTVIALQEYVPRDVTSRALDVAAAFPTSRVREATGPLPAPRRRVPVPDSIDPRKGRAPAKVAVHGVRAIQFGTQEIDVTALEQIVDPSQLRALGQAIAYAREGLIGGDRSIADVVDGVMAAIAERGLGVIDHRPVGGYAAFRRHELAAALNRLRTLVVR